MNDNEILKKLVRIAKRQQTIIGKIAQLSEQSASPMQTEENQKNENFVKSMTSAWLVNEGIQSKNYSIKLINGDHGSAYTIYFNIKMDKSKISAFNPAKYQAYMREQISKVPGHTLANKQLAFDVQVTPVEGRNIQCRIINKF